MRRWSRLLTAAAGGLFAIVPVGSAASASAHLGVLIPSGPRTILPTGAVQQYSLNWSGYAYNPGSGITAVTSTYVVPAVQSSAPGFSAAWTGIGGDGTSDLIQAGTGQDSEGGASYYAWYEILPASETPISNCTGSAACTVTPGDTMTVAITETSLNVWTITMTASGTDNWTWSINNLAYTSSHSSAEWILEAPTVGAQTVLSHVGNVRFDPNNTFTRNGVTQNMGAVAPDQIVLSPDPTGLIPVHEATPSGIDGDRDGFLDCSYQSTCATPGS
jgi:hypothetical protein